MARSEDTLQVRVLHCPTTVGGNAPGLARAERHVGLSSHAVSFEQNVFQYDVDEVLWKDSDGILQREWKRWKLLWRALRHFDVVHLNFGQTILPVRFEPRGIRGRLFSVYVRAVEFLDLRLLKMAGKAVVVTYQGDDARQGDYLRRNYEISPADEAGEGYYTTRSDRRKRDVIGVMAGLADLIFALNPDLLGVLPDRAQFLPYASVDPVQWMPPDRAPGAVPVVLHAPSHRGVKGTRFVTAAVDRLKAEGVPFEFVMVEGLSREEARRVYERADLLVDQLLCGWYGGLAVEAMALGVPVVAYVREADLQHIPEDMRAEIPVVNATPDTIYRVMRDLLTNHVAELPALGRRSRAFVERWHDPLSIAQRLKGEYESLLGRASETSPSSGHATEARPSPTS